MVGMEGKYIYCVIATEVSRMFGLVELGGRSAELHTICFSDIAAVVSNSPIIDYSLSRDNLLAHEKAIEKVMKEYTVLPVRFCTIAENEAATIKILEKEYGRFKELLNNMKDKKELGLKAIFKEETVYGDIIENYKEIRMLKENIARLPPEKTYYQRMEIGKMVEDALESEKKKRKNEILDVLKPLAEETKLNNTYGERMVINAAFLVHKDREVEFDRKVNELDGKYGGKIKFKYTGTLPPFNFVNLVINTSTLLSVNGERKSNH